MNNNHRKRFNLYTQGQRLAVRGLFILGIFFGSVPAVLAQGFFEKVLAGALVLSVGLKGVNPLDLLKENDRGLLGQRRTTPAVSNSDESVSPDYDLSNLPAECQRILTLDENLVYQGLMIDIHNEAHEQDDDGPKKCIGSLKIECQSIFRSEKNMVSLFQCDQQEGLGMIRGIYSSTIQRLLNGDCKEIFDLYKQDDLPTLYVQYLWNKEVKSTLKIYLDSDGGKYIVDHNADDANC